jgi:hypothetical protein
MKTFFVLLLSALSCTVVQADEPPTVIGSLQPGKDYLIKFSAGSDVFELKDEGITESQYTTTDGKKRSGGPVKWSLKATVDIFRLVRFGKDPWVAVEHPAEKSDIIKWNAKRTAMAQLNAENVLHLDSTEDGKQVLERLRMAAAKEITTTVSWINLNYVVAISEVPTQLTGRLRIATSDAAKPTEVSPDELKRELPDSPEDIRSFQSRAFPQGK